MQHGHVTGLKKERGRAVSAAVIASVKASLALFAAEEAARIATAQEEKAMEEAAILDIPGETYEPVIDQATGEALEPITNPEFLQALDAAIRDAFAANKASEQMLGKAKALLVEGRGRWDNDRKTAHILSETDNHQRYRVTATSCTCQAATYGDERCKHGWARDLALTATQALRPKAQPNTAAHVGFSTQRPKAQPNTAAHVGFSTQRPVEAPKAHTPTPIDPLEQKIQGLLDKGFLREEIAVVRPSKGQPYPVVKYVGLLRRVHELGIVSLSAEFTYLEPELAIAKAVIVLKDGRTFTEYGDATPDNVGPQVKAHFRRMALTRAKARCCRDILTEVAPAEEELAE